MIYMHFKLFWISSRTVHTEENKEKGYEHPLHTYINTVTIHTITNPQKSQKSNLEPPGQEAKKLSLSQWPEEYKRKIIFRWLWVQYDKQMCSFTRTKRPINLGGAPNDSAELSLFPCAYIRCYSPYQCGFTSEHGLHPYPQVIPLCLYKILFPTSV